MPRPLTRRSVKPELLDTMAVDDPRAMASRRDLVRINAVMFQSAIMARLLRANLERKPLRILEIGAGDGRFMLSVARRLAPQWPDVEMILLNQADLLAPGTKAAFAALGWRVQSVVADVFEWIDGPEIGVFDAVSANLFLHHFEEPELGTLLSVMPRLTSCFLATEPRRSGLALWCTGWLRAIGANAVTLHDAAASVRAALTTGHETALHAIGRMGARVVTWWKANVDEAAIAAWVRTLVRRRESWLVVLATLVGVLAGILVLLLRETAYHLQQVLYQLPPEHRLSALGSLPLAAAQIPASGGVLLGLIGLALNRRKSRYVDLVGANALHGGKLSMPDSLIITGQTLISNGFGASVGLEAAYTQMGGGVASKLGDLFQLRRRDMRKLWGAVRRARLRRRSARRSPGLSMRSSSSSALTPSPPWRPLWQPRSQPSWSRHCLVMGNPSWLSPRSRRSAFHRWY